jgi:nicotinic acid mononucleotide adenylyltransferase
VLEALERPERVEFFDMEPIPISSSDIRRLVSEGRPVRNLVPPAVAAEIERLGLYRRPAG